jgi:branched-chain amino acid transport system permease protein
VVTFLQQLSNGLIIGSMYALIALGYTMVYGILQLINFAHGEVFMIGSYIGLAVLSFFVSSGLSATVPVAAILLVTFLVAMASCALLGVGIERLAYRPLRHSSRLSLLITALGISIALQNLVMLTMGARDKPYPSDFFPRGEVVLGGVHLSYIQIFILSMTLVLMVGLNLLVKKTKLGKAMRATAQDHEAAGLMGINPNLIIMMTFAIGSALGAAAGVLFGLYYGITNFYIGFQAGMKAFTAAVLGGIGNMGGAMLGGLLLGVLESLCAGYISSQWKDVFAFAILILVLVFRPAGLLGEQVPEKV